MYHVRRYGWDDGRVYKYVVTDQPLDWSNPTSRYDDGVAWPSIAEFPVSLRHSADDQQERAHEYMEYLNSHIRKMPAIGS